MKFLIVMLLMLPACATLQKAKDEGYAQGKRDQAIRDIEQLDEMEKTVRLHKRALRQCRDKVTKMEGVMWRGKK